MEYCSGAFHQEFPTCLRSGRFRAGLVSHDHYHFGGPLQIILQAVRITYQFVRNTINSEPPNIDGQTMKSWMGVARVLRA